MTSAQVLIANAVKILLLLTFVGIVARRRAHLCWSFTAYLALILSCNCLSTFWPDRFYTNWFWILKQSLYDAFKMAIALELAYRVFQAFPSAQATARKVVFVLLFVTALVLTGVPRAASPEGPSIYGAALLEWEPRLLTGMIWVLNGLALLVIWYRVPMHTFHKAILLGFVPYLLVFTTLLSLLKHYGWEILPIIQAAEPAAYLLLVGWWAYAAWAPESAPDVSPAVLQFLQPWRARA
jgi:hypothetical protein